MSALPAGGRTGDHSAVRDLDLKTLRLFIAVCDCRTMARAAAQERIEPSAVSKRIAQLEDDLGVELLVRARRGVEPTPAGLALLERARDVVFAIDRIDADAASFAAGLVTSRVRLLATSAAIAEGLLGDIAAFMREPANEGIRVDLEERESRDLVRDILDGRASLGVCADETDLGGLARRPYRRDRLVLAVYAGHALAGRASVRFAEMLDFEHVGLPPSTAVHALLRREAARLDRAVPYRTVVSTFDAALRVVAANLGMGIVPLAIGRRSAVDVDLQLIPIADAWAERGFVLCFRSLEALPAASRRLADHLAAQAAGAMPG
jgi:DNA-binding transcriptional LysR family regulator